MSIIVFNVHCLFLLGSFIIYIKVKRTHILPCGVDELRRACTSKPRRPDCCTAGPQRRPLRPASRQVEEYSLPLCRCASLLPCPRTASGTVTRTRTVLAGRLGRHTARLSNERCPGPALDCQSPATQWQTVGLY